VLLGLYFKHNLVHSQAGKTLVAIRENPIASSCVGVNVHKYKVMAFAVGALYAGVGGALYAHLVTFISPETFSLEQSVAFLTMVLLGGSGSFWGPIVGAGIIHSLWEGLQDFREAQMAIYGMVIVLVLFFMPTGITGKLRQLFTKRYRSD
jgi:branched-chain amino acid transport system permease protein